MQHYELLFITPLQSTEQEQQKLVERVRDMATTNGMRVGESKELGRRRLAYPIKKTSQGYYFAFEFDGEPAGVAKLNRELKLLQNDIVRHSLVKKRVVTAEDIKREHDIRERVKAREWKTEQAKLAEEKTPVGPVKEEKKPAEVKKISLEDLDKKLDEILKEEV